RMEAAEHERRRARERVRALRAPARRDGVVRPQAAPAGRARPAAAGLTGHRYPAAPMTAAVRAVAAAALIAAPTVLAFFTGGFRDDARLIAGIVVWALVVLAALFAERPLPRSTAGRIALAGAALLAIWTGVSMAWSPVSSAAVDDTQRVLMYAGALVAAAGF